MRYVKPLARALKASVAMLPLLAFGQTKSNQPVLTSVCEVVQTPASFNGKIITVRGRILIGFENFEISLAECAAKKIDDLWLEYGRGPKRQPTTWCCGDMIPRDRLALLQNAEFQRFHRYVTAMKKEKGCYDCYLYQVTATLTGRFDAVDPSPGELCGFGHLGIACGRLVIGAVSDVVAEPVDNSALGH